MMRLHYRIRVILFLQSVCVGLIRYFGNQSTMISYFDTQSIYCIIKEVLLLLGGLKSMQYLDNEASKELFLTVSKMSSYVYISAI